jgi:hypothetical protein
MPYKNEALNQAILLAISVYMLIQVTKANARRKRDAAAEARGEKSLR